MRTGLGVILNLMRVNMTWHELSISVPYEYVEPISYLFDRYGHGMSIEIQDQKEALLRTYLPSTSRQRLAHIEVGVKLAGLLEPLGDLNIRALTDDEDWQNAWKSHFSLLKLGQNLVIRPSWVDYEPKKNEQVIDLDPGLAFGTGYHPTTYTCLEALERLIKPNFAVLDLGTGSGILTVAAAKLGAREVLALDTDPVAVKAANQNFQRSNLGDNVTAAQGSVPHRLVVDSYYDLVLANISARAIAERAESIYPILKGEGHLIASGIISDQRHTAETGLKNAGFNMVEACIKEDWVTLICRPV